MGRRVTSRLVIMDMLISAIVLSVLCQLPLCESFHNKRPQDYSECQREPDKCIDLTTIKCENSKYRTFNGACNNPVNPTLGMALTPYTRLLPANYGDGISSMRTSRNGSPLPSARLLSYKIFGRKSMPDPNLTMLNMQWGQLVTHDVTIRQPGGFPGLKAIPEKRMQCCSRSGRYETRATSVPCFPIPVAKNDPYFRGIECIDFDRSITDRDQQCPGTEGLVPAEQISGVTHYLDLSFVYGNSKEQNRGLRTLRNGFMKTSDPKQNWPPRSSIPEFHCPAASAGELCYEFGDARGNQNLGLTSLQIVLLREHNRLARELGRLNRHWGDETLFQEARRINIAQFQHITYYEWNINFYGAQRMYRHDLIYKSWGGEYVNDYDPCVDPRNIHAFSQSSFRYFHNQIMGVFHLINERRQVYNDSIGVTEFVDRPGILEQGCQYNSLIRGLSAQAASLTDNNFDIEVAEKFVTPVLLGPDLRAFDIQRDRDHGLASYNDFREYCGLKRARSWRDYADYISAENIRKMQGFYKSFEDVELSIGAALENHDPESLAGPTFMCINLIQFKNLRSGDRYFYENEMQPYPFTNDQLAEIRKASVARLLCDNSNVQNMQPYAFRRISRRNPLHPCSALPRIDLRKWKE